MLGASYTSYRDSASSANRQISKLRNNYVAEDDTHEVMGRHMPVRRALIPAKCDGGSDEFMLTSLPVFDIDDRVHNALLEELCADYGVSDSTDIDLTFDLLPSSRLSAGTVTPLGETVSWETHEKLLTNKPVEQSKNILSNKNKSSSGSNNIVDMSKAVASPTISSSCEENQPDIQSGDDSQKEYVSLSKLTTLAAAGNGVISRDVSVSAQSIGKTDDRKITESLLENQKLADGKCVQKRELATSDCRSPHSSAEDSFSTSSSPSQMHVSKKPRVIANGGDLLDEMKDTYGFVRGANIYTPSKSQATSLVPNSQPFWPVSSAYAVSNNTTNALSNAKNSSCNYQTGEVNTSWNFYNNGGAQMPMTSMPVAGNDYFQRGNNPNYSQMRPMLDLNGVQDSQKVHQLIPSRVGPMQSPAHGEPGYSNQRTMPLFENRASYTDGRQAQVGSWYSEPVGKTWETSNIPFSMAGGGVPLTPHRQPVRVPSESYSDGRTENCYPNALAPNSNSSQFSGSTGRLTGSSQQVDQFNKGCQPSYSQPGGQCMTPVRLNGAGINSQMDTVGLCGSPGRFITRTMTPTHQRSGSVDQFSECKTPLASRDSCQSNYSSSCQCSQNLTSSCAQSGGIQNYMPRTPTRPIHSGYGMPNNQSAPDMLLTVQPSYPASAITSDNKQQETLQNQLHMQHASSMGTLSSAMTIHNNRPSSSDNSRPLQPAAQNSQSVDQGCRGFVQHLVGEGSAPYRAHPLFPLLRDIVIADMNFDMPSFPFAVLSGIPRSFDRLVENYFNSNPQAAANVHIDPSIDGVIVDALRYAHSALIDKIKCRKLKEGYQGVPRVPVDDMCNQFSQFNQPCNDQMSADRLYATNSSSFINRSAKVNGLPTPLSTAQQHSYCGPPSKPTEQWSGFQYPEIGSSPGRLVRSQHLPLPPVNLNVHQERLQLHPEYFGSFSDGGESTASSEKTNKNKVLPNEAKAIMVEWLREHQENPYPNDDEKEELMNSTKLTISQINYWFTNARRRLLPKWAMQRRHAFERDSEQSAIPIQ